MGLTPEMVLSILTTKLEKAVIGQLDLSGYAKKTELTTETTERKKDDTALSEAIVRLQDDVSDLKKGGTGSISVSDDGDGHLTIASTSGTSVVDDGEGHLTIGV